ncbi:ABC-type Fe3+-siderophore transport system, permease 2 component [Geomicrobium sp. JCM 19037]|uniref:FecCD family ABC transporter permease n=1 Tax=unclassified Geomicrobium TaxID=2628951 RepID=UPI00045F425C|nr:iron chelate uptake ABC transporter family permease subunit [Geomicrobium sp. JCM 19037]GAK02204.1 ABC-type Fe3+-siderophore transport system, permease 2 component [Geomicrobium sp. JCM 19037]
MMNSTIGRIRNERRRRFTRRAVVTSALFLLVLMLCTAMLMLGNTIYPVQDVVRVLLGEEIAGMMFAIETIRLPRMLAGLLAGIAFGIAGNTFQTMLRNPLANPDILGITAGSTVAALVCILLLQTSRATVSVSAIIAGLVTVVVIYFLSRGNGFSIGRLVLVGIGIQAILSATILYLLMIGAQEDLPNAMRWMSGSLNGVQMHQLVPLAISMIVCIPLLVFTGRHLLMLELGESAALSLGVQTDRTRIVLIVASVIMLALATAVTGPIAFVAFLSGPIAKRLTGEGSPSIIGSGLVGATLVLGADLLGQFAFDVRYPVGVITGMMGAPFLLYLLIRMNRRGNL